MWNRRIWWCVAGMIAFDMVGLFYCGMSVDFTKAIAFFIVLAACFILSLFYHYVRRDDYLFFLGQITAQLLLAILSMGLMSYLGQRLNLPLTDDVLIAIDRALGFDWHAYIAWADENRWASRLFTLAYFSSGPQVMLIVAILFITKQVAHIQRYIIAFILTALITIFFASIFPAVAGYIYYDVDIANAYPHLHPAAGRIHEAPLMALRDGSMQTLVFPLEGIVTFPSFHSALSILLIYASWPVTWLRRISIPLNILVLFATPVDGGHWLIDVIGGVAIALCVIALVRRLTPGMQTIQAA